MAPIVKFLFAAVLFLCIAVQSNAHEDSPYARHDWECTPWDNITVTTVATGKTVNATKQWNATFTNVCRCSQLDIIVNATGFSSREYIDPLVLDYSDKLADLNKGAGGLYPYESVSFTYAADEPFYFEGVTCELDCPTLAPALAPAPAPSQ